VKRSERLLHQISTNLREKQHVEWIGVRFAEKSRQYLKKKRFRELVRAMNKTGPNERFSIEDFACGKVYPTESFFKEYEENHGIKTCGVCLILRSKQWKTIKDKIGQYSWAGGIYKSPAEFSDYSTNHFPIQHTGIILTDNTSETTIEHECLHADIEAYSQNYDSLTRWETSGYTNTNILHKAEGDYLTELSAYRDELSGNLEQIMRDLQEDYIPETLNFLDKTLKYVKRSRIEKILEELKNKIPTAAQATTFLVSLLPDNMLTPVMFSFGPTLEKMSNGRYHSPLNDLINFAELIEEKEITKDQIRKKLNTKGYLLR